jgi:hypothetical protein
MKHTEMIMVIEAHSEGKAVQVSAKLANLGWTDMKPATGFNFCEFDYRVKPELKESVNVLEFGAIKDDGMMKITLDLPEIEGYEYTGEHRQAEAGDYYLEVTNEAAFRHLNCGKTRGHYPILKKKAPKYETRFIDKQNCLWIGDDQGIREGKTYVEIKALREAIAIIDSHYNWSADLRAATLELKELLN